jgi:tetratricopeptide (TPR) repeat protein
LAAHPDHPGYALTGARLLKRNGRSREAHAAFEAALALFVRLSARLDERADPATFVERQRIETFILAGRNAEAIAILDAGLRRQSDNVQLLAARCRARAEANLDLPRALRDCNQALEYDSGHMGAMMARGLIHLRMERWTQAIADYGAAISWAPHNAEAHYGRALARLRSGDRPGSDTGFAAARRYEFDIEATFAEYGIAVPADAPRVVAQAD